MKEFKDPIAYKARTSSYNFVAPRKEQATTGRFMDAGDNYGLGFKQPVGKEKDTNNGPIPRKPMCFPPGDAIRE